MPASAAPTVTTIGSDTVMTVDPMEARLAKIEKQVGAIGRNLKAVMRHFEISASGKASGTSGFHRPIEVSAELAAFMGLADGELTSRVAVTKFISAYVREHDLQVATDRRRILPDEPLRKLLGLEPEVLSSFISLQGSLKGHFPPSVASVKKRKAEEQAAGSAGVTA